MIRVVVGALAAAIVVVGAAPAVACPDTWGIGIIAPDSSGEISATTEIRTSFDLLGSGFEPFVRAIDGDHPLGPFADTTTTLVVSGELPRGEARLITVNRFCADDPSCAETHATWTVVDPDPARPDPLVVESVTLTRFSDGELFLCHDEPTFFVGLDDETPILVVRFEALNDEAARTLRARVEVRRRDEARGVTLISRASPPSLVLSDGSDGVMMKLDPWTGPAELEIRVTAIDLDGDESDTAVVTRTVDAGCGGGCAPDSGTDRGGGATPVVGLVVGLGLGRLPRRLREVRRRSSW